MNMEKIQILILTYKKREAEHSCRTNYCRLQVFVSSQTSEKCHSWTLYKARGYSRSRWAAVQCRVGNAVSCETQLLHPSPQCCFQASTFKFLSLCTWQFGEGAEVVTCILHKSLKLPAQPVLVCCCPEHRSNLFHELELPKLADFVHLKLDPSWCVKWCLK